MTRASYAVRDLSGAGSTRRHLVSAVHRPATSPRTAMLERCFTRVFDRLVYAQIWEDPVVDLAALDLTPTDRMITIASGGCNVLSYLTAAPREILAVDLNDHHLALTRMRLAAAAHLPDHAAFFRFLGRADEPANRESYRQHLGARLDHAGREYWERRDWRGRARIDMFSRNLYRHGVLGRFITMMHGLARLHGVDLKLLARAADQQAQRQFFAQQVAPLFAGHIGRWLGERSALLFGLGIPPAQARLLAMETGGDLTTVLLRRLERLACGFPIRQNYFALQAFDRSYARCEPAFLPPYLQPEHFDKVRQGVRRVVPSHQSVTGRLARERQASLDAYVLLDAQDWMTDGQLNSLWREATRTARAGARLIFRTAGLAPGLEGRVAPELLDQWDYQPQASAAGTAADRSAIYGGFHLYVRGARRLGA